MGMSESELRRAIRDLAKDGKVPCLALLELTGRAGVPARTVGRLCDEMKIKIAACQLGCFR